METERHRNYPTSKQLQRGVRKGIVVKVVIPEMKQWLHNKSTFVLEFAISRKHPM